MLTSVGQKEQGHYCCGVQASGTLRQVDKLLQKVSTKDVLEETGAGSLRSE